MRTATYNPVPLIEARKRLYGTQKEFAVALKRQREIVRRLERGQQTSLETLREACALLGLNVSVQITPSDKTCEISPQFAQNAT